MHRIFIALGLLLAANTTAPGGTAFVLSYPVNGDAAGDQFGRRVSGAGDVNNDGYDDFIVGAWEDDNNGEESGSARVFSGATGAILHTFFGDSPGDSLGCAVSGAGDINNDGFADLIVGMRGADNNGLNSGSARVYSGIDGSILFTIHGDSPGDLFGTAVSGIGDVNNDGVPDLLVGAPRDDNNGADSGSVRIVSGANGAELFTRYGRFAGANYGHAVSAIGDINGDGVNDLIVGAPFDSDKGSVRVLSGATAGILFTFVGDTLYDEFGTSVSGAGDVDNDGINDLIVGASHDDDNGSRSGSARVFSGADGSILYTFYGDSWYDEFGISVSDAGDTNGDGFGDIIVGAWGDDNAGNVSGSVRLFSGFDGSILATFDGPSGSEFGVSVSNAGDVNNDGVDDMIVGSHREDNNGYSSGSARIILSVVVPATPVCPGDLTGDDIVNFADLNEVLSNFGAPCPE